MLRNRLYTEEQVLQVVDEVLCRLDSTRAPQREQEHLDNSISHKALPSDAKAALSVKEAAGEIGISLPKMYELVQTGKFNTVKVGKRILISRQSLMDWLSKGD